MIHRGFSIPQTLIPNTSYSILPFNLYYVVGCMCMNYTRLVIRDP